jgi:enoyl-CoA hydratase/carnithine racemase
MNFFQITEEISGIKTVTITNPKKKNALNKAAYQSLANILNEAGKDDQTKCVVITGAGDFFR